MEDYHTKWPEAFPLPDQEARTIAHIIVEQVICRCEAPHILLTDRGRNFQSHLIEEIFLLPGVKQHATTAYHLQCNGLVEASNGVLQKILFKLVEEYPKDWDMYLDRALWDCRVSQKSATGFAPFFLVYGEKCGVPINVMLSTLEFIL